MNLDNGVCGPDGCLSPAGVVDHGHKAFITVSDVRETRMGGHDCMTE